MLLIGGNVWYWHGNITGLLEYNQGSDGLDIFLKEDTPLKWYYVMFSKVVTWVVPNYWKIM